MEISAATWNLAGAKLLKTMQPASGGPAAPATVEYTAAYAAAWKQFLKLRADLGGSEPDIILLQECIGFSAGNDPLYSSGDAILGHIFPGYHCKFFPALSSRRHPHPRKWAEYRLPPEVDVQQGYGVCIKERERLRTLWIQADRDHRSSSRAPDAADDEQERDLCFEAVNLTTGAYLGNRDTEPRLAVWGRTKFGEGEAARYVNFVNLHLTTLKGEREGNVQRNRAGSKRRLAQIELVLEDVVSAYHHPDANRFRFPSDPAEHRRTVWILAGDFNAGPESEEISAVVRAGFVDGNPFKELRDQTGVFSNKVGTKWVAKDARQPPTVVDYVFFGLSPTSFPLGCKPGGIDAGGTRPLPDYMHPFRPKFDDGRFETDHAIVFASLDPDK